MRRVLFALLVGAGVSYASGFGMFKDVIFKSDGTKILLTSDRGANWDSINLDKNIADALVEKSQVIFVLDDISIQISNDFNNFKNIKPILSGIDDDDISMISKISLMKVKNEYFLILKRASSINFNKGYVLKSRDLKRFQVIHNGNLEEWDKKYREATKNSKLKDVQDNYCETVGNKKSCYLVNKLILSEDGESRVIREDKREFGATSDEDESEFMYYRSNNNTLHGFDKCEAPTIKELKAWKNSPYIATNLYIGGNRRNSYCRPTNDSRITSSYIKDIYNIGFKIIPTWVGPQPYDIKYFSNAYNKGVEEAKKAIKKMRNLNIMQLDGKGGGVVYYDLEPIKASTKQNNTYLNRIIYFLNGWADELKQNNISVGFYFNISDLKYLKSITDKTDFFWYAHYNNKAEIPSEIFDVWGEKVIKQYENSHNETWGGITLNIDCDSISKSNFNHIEFSSEIQTTVDGAGSLVSPGENCWGCNKDVAVMHPHYNLSSTVVFQNLFDLETCAQVELYASKDIDVIVQSKAWYSNKIEESFKVKLHNDRDRSVTLRRPGDNPWTTFAVTSLKPVDEAVKIYAKCNYFTTFNDGNREVIANSPVKVNYDFSWLGTGSIISGAQERGFDSFGISKDVAVTSNTQNATTTFQWYASSSCQKLQLSASDIEANGVYVYFKGWANETWQYRCNNTLPCTIDAPSLDNYYVIKIEATEGTISGSRIEAVCK